ncbi:esterase/lipase family protein [Arthrobacter sp. H14]|uniref:esterase/lipase family protein n=1 Tax=Arthrobacter sp. H14 TaxID=1312959 RepID=UPI0004B396A8|nr:alpha/beta fold hydrolase [Arthrobacter sp. H14]
MLKTGPRRRISGLFHRGWSWFLDYVYVAFWQVHGFLFRTDAARYLQDVDPRCRPVLLLPGIYERWQFMHPIAERLHDRGHPVHVVDGLGYNRGSVAKMAGLVQDYLALHDLQDVYIVAHSKGGLIGKYVMSDDDDGGRVTGMAAINTPFSGSVYARFFLLPSIRAFAPSNKILRTLAGNQGVNSRITSIFSAWDPHIPGGSHLPGATNIELESHGHFRTLADPGLLAAVEHAVQTPPSNTP